MSSPSISNVRTVYIEWHVDIVMDLIDQILKSPQLISGTNQINPNDATHIKKNQKKIATVALEKEADYLIKKYKITDTDELFKVIGDLSSKKIETLRRKCIDEAIKELAKNG